jgi:hypothetical protein
MKLTTENVSAEPGIKEPDMNDTDVALFHHPCGVKDPEFWITYLSLVVE